MKREELEALERKRDEATYKAMAATALWHDLLSQEHQALMAYVQTPWGPRAC